jgi:hypothetical protein
LTLLSFSADNALTATSSSRGSDEYSGVSNSLPKTPKAENYNVLLDASSVAERANSAHRFSNQTYSFGNLTEVKGEVSPLPKKHGNVLFRQSRLFRKFAFKGFGLHLSKNPFDLKSLCFGVKIPITQNFPAYDSVIFLPRVNALIAVNYPFSFRVSFSISVPLQVISMLVIVMARQLYLKSLPSEVSAIGTSVAAAAPGKIVWPTLRSSDSVTRLGLTIAYRYSKKLGHHRVLGPSILYLPGIQMVRRLLPLIIVFPALLLGIMLWAYQSFQAYVLDSFSRSLLQRQRNNSQRRNIPQSVEDVVEDNDEQLLPSPHSVSVSPSSISSPSSPQYSMVRDGRASTARRHKSVLVAEYNPETSSQVGSAAYALASSTALHGKPPSGYQYRPMVSSHPLDDAPATANIVSAGAVRTNQTPFGDAYGIIEQWLLSKSPTFGAQVGYYDTKNVLALGYSTTLELQPFFSFSRFNSWRKAREQKKSSNDQKRP